MTKIIIDTIKRIGKKIFSPKYLLITNSMTGIISVSIGDSIQQLIEFNLENKYQNNERKPFEFNKRRNLNMMFAGIYFGVFGHMWYSFLDRRFPGRNKRSVAKKLLSEMAMGPPLISGLFLIIGRLKGMTFDNSWNDLKSNFGLICAVEWIVYIPLQYINFAFFRPQYRYLYVATISIGYDAFLSYIMHRNERQKRLKYLKEENNNNNNNNLELTSI